jgi:hypothetical protein
MDAASKTLRWIRIWVVFFILALVASGITAIPMQWEMHFASDVLHALPQWLPDLTAWIDRVREGLDTTYAAYPFIAYGTDWLAFAHFVIAIAFVGPLRDPIRNIWIIQWGMIACVLVLPLAFIAGPLRGIPFGWQLIDISFGVFGIIPLYVVYRLIRRLERERAADNAGESV